MSDRGPTLATMSGRHDQEADPEPVDPSELPRLARAVIEADRFPFLATIDGTGRGCGRSRRCAPTASRSTSPTSGATTRPEEIEANPEGRARLPERRPRSGADLGPRRGRHRWGAASGDLGGEPAAAPLSRLARQPRADRLPDRAERVRFMREWALEYHDVAIDRAEGAGSSSSAALQAAEGMVVARRTSGSSR